MKFDAEKIIAARTSSHPMVEKHHNIENRQEVSNYRISFFGTGSSKSEHDLRAMQIAEGLARSLTGYGHKIVTGGYESGVMGAASRGAYQKAKELHNDNLIPDGITFGKEFGKPSEFANNIDVSGLLERLRILINNSNALVVFHGKTGTLVEMITSIWQAAGEAMVKKESHSPKPVIIIDSSLEHTDILSQVNKRDSKFKYAMDNVYVVNATISSEVDEIINKVLSIVELYYKKSSNDKLGKDDEDYLQNLSLRKFLSDGSHFSEGGGI